MKFKYYNILAGVLLMVSCDKELPEVDSPDFDVTTKSTTYAVDSLVTFDITGEAGIVSFYSGEPLKEYAFKGGRVVDNTTDGARLSFTSAVPAGGTQGTLSATVPPQLSVKASTDFNGKYDFASVQSATWIDITARFRYGIAAAFVSSTPVPPVTVPVTPTIPVDISDLLVTGKPIYIAYKYVTKPQAPAALNGTARNWQIESFLVASKKNIGTIAKPISPTIANLISAGFRLVDQNPLTAPARSTLTTTRISLLGNLYDATNDPGNDPLSENWAITKPIYTSTIDLGPDRPLAIKEHAKATALRVHTHKYTEPGIYKATFVATNVNLDGSKQVVKEVVITVK